MEFFKKFLRKISQYILRDQLSFIEAEQNEMKVWREAMNSLLTPTKIEEIKNPDYLFSDDMRFKIKVVKTRNENIAEFHSSTPFYLTGEVEYSFEYPLKQQDCLLPCSCLVVDIFSIEKCTHLKLRGFCVEFHKSPALEWNEIIPELRIILFKNLELTNCSK